ncbi:hypothetical protein CHUAL_013130 [Chamberlinius hualienensis]
MMRKYLMRDIVDLMCRGLSAALTQVANQINSLIVKLFLIANNFANDDMTILYTDDIAWFIPNCVRDFPRISAVV